MGEYARPHHIDCPTCAGNGEIVTDWAVYLHPPEGAPPEAGTADCPDCDGIGSLAVVGSASLSGETK
ncbi:MAG TPA: hypothetical protein VJ775_06050 [Sphingomicrobium sp.]|nr:hypothetical protein [Sphingomicrobium sp.]